MCLAVPVRVEEVLEAGMIKCRVGDSDTFVTASSALLEEALQVGEYTIVHAGFALRKIEAADAEETLRLLREMVDLVEEDLQRANRPSCPTI